MKSNNIIKKNYYANIISENKAITAFFRKNEEILQNYETANSLLQSVSGIQHFFASQSEAIELLEEVKKAESAISEPDRREYGDFQTNHELAFQVTKYTASKAPYIEFVLEPTCGKGSFILAAIQSFHSLKKIVGVEIYKPYVWTTKFKILGYFLENKAITKPDIQVIHADAFEFPYPDLADSTKNLKTLILGNPPWVTNSELGSVNSKNLPKKSNFKKHKGLEAITGKGNFDIGESISAMMLKNFQCHNGLFAFLIKKSVVKNLIYDQKQTQFKIGRSEVLGIDAKKEFNVSVQAGLFLTHLNIKPQETCKELDFYQKKEGSTFGWHQNKFVSSIKKYNTFNFIDGKSIFVWRSGVKHDCSKVMELQQANGHYINKFGEEIELEKDLVYGLLKSSDLKNRQTNSFRKLTIVTQKKVGQSTNYIKNDYPLTYKYLDSYKELFNKRKSSIYRGKPQFSIFGIGDYSFAPYKVAISGFYKTTHFTLVKPNDSKAIMLDDTCYFIGFEQLEMAKIAHYIVNCEMVQKFLQAIIFSDSKRAITKDILMRIDFKKAYEKIDFEETKRQIPAITINHWREFGEMLIARKTGQLELF